MFAKLTALVSSGPTFPYTLGEAYRAAWGSWTHFRGKAKEDGAAVSIFKISAASKSDPKLQSARNGVKRLKMVRCHKRRQALFWLRRCSYSLCLQFAYAKGCLHNW